jgi:hypothetical protein
MVFNLSLPGYTEYETHREIAKIIDRETGLAQLLAAAENSANTLENLIRMIRERGAQNTWVEYDNLLDLRDAISWASATTAAATRSKRARSSIRPGT